MTEVSTKEKGVVKQKEEYLPTEKIEGDPAWVSVSADARVNLGGFEVGRVNNGKIGISITYPCEPSKVDWVFDTLKDWIDSRLSKEIAELKESAQKPKDVEI